MEVRQTPTGRYYKYWGIAPVGDPVLTKDKREIPSGMDEGTLLQVEALASMPFVYPHLSIMPDVHWGRGASVGCVIPTKGAIIPSAVGVDGGCGMMAVRLDIDAKILTKEVLERIYADVCSSLPMGRSCDINGKYNVDVDSGSWSVGQVPEFVEQCWLDNLADEFNELAIIHPNLERCSPLEQLGTLGTGNHFVEMSVDEKGNVWLVLHSGSRGVGNHIGSFFMKKAKEDMERRFYPTISEDLAFLVEGDELFNQYIRCMSWVQEYARMNRNCIAMNVLMAIEDALSFVDQDFTELLELQTETSPSRVSCHHNYVRQENHGGINYWIARKGAIRAGDGDWGIIPGAMGRESYIVRGLGNPESFCSASHGAGRKMGRNQARKQFSKTDLETSMKDIIWKEDVEIIDEIADAYKDVKAVMEAQKDLVTPVHTLRQIVSWKG